MKKTLLIVIITVFMAGCQYFEKQPDGRYIITPETSQRIDQGLDTSQEIAEAAMAVGMVWPGISAIGGIMLGVTGILRKMKPKLEEAESKAELAGMVTTELVTAIEKYKPTSPDGWRDLKKVLLAELSKQTIAEINRTKGI